MVREIPLTKGKVALVDDDDFERVNAHKWTLRTQKGKSYAHRKLRVNGKQTSQYLHRFILGITGREQGDHKNGDGLDNTRGNLRRATQYQNNCNRGPQRNNRTGFKGVFFDPRYRRPFKASVWADGKCAYVGTFDTAEEAARAYDAKAKELHGEFAWLNFPDERIAA